MSHFNKNIKIYEEKEIKKNKYFFYINKNKQNVLIIRFI